MMTLSEYMQREGLTDAEFAARAGIDRSTVSRLRRNKQWPRYDAALAIYQATGGKVSWVPSVEASA